MIPDMAAYLGPFMEHLARRDRAAAVAEALALVDAAVPVQIVMEGLLARAQVEVGVRWERNEWSVADEHAATSTNEAVLAAVAATIDVRPTRGTVVVACVEGEWHRLPAQIASELLRLEGFDVVFLGASTPPDGLASFLSDVRPVALALSCTVSLHLPGVLRTIEAVRPSGVPVLVGGGAFGDDDRRALRLGADAWARSVADALPVLEAWEGAVRPARPPLPAARAPGLPLAEERPALAAAAFDDLERRFPAVRTYDARQRARIREDLGTTLAFLEAAVLADDRRIVDDHRRWLAGVLAARGLPAELVPRMEAALASAVGAERAEAAGMLHGEAAGA